MPLYQIVRIIDAITFGQMIDFYDVQAVYNYFGYPVSRLRTSIATQNLDDNFWSTNAKQKSNTNVGLFRP